MSCLSMIQDVTRELGISVPNAAVTSSDQQVVQLLALLNKEGKALADRVQEGWQVLQKEATFTTVASEIQISLLTLAPNCKFIIQDTIWNRTTRRPIYGSLSPQAWQQRKGWFSTTPYSQYRLTGGNIEFSPVPNAGDNCYFEYVTKNWKTDSTGATGGDTFTNDADISLLDEELLKLGLIWRWKAAKGFDYAESIREYEDRVNTAIARDIPRNKLSLNRGSHELPYLNVPETGFGV